jgi:hypothetical protein
MGQVTIIIEEDFYALTDDERRELAASFGRWLGIGAGARLRQRDAAIRSALALYAGIAPTASAKILSRDLSRYLDASGRREIDLVELPATVSELRKALHRIVRTNGNRSLGWRQILSVGEGHRGRPLRRS